MSDELQQLPLDAHQVVAAGRTFFYANGRWWAQNQAGTYRPASWLIRNLADLLLDDLLDRNISP